MHHAEVILVAGAVLVLLGAVASKIAGRLGIPAIILFLGIGMVAGSDGPGGIHFSNYEMARTVGSVALCFILFAGGLDTQWKHVRPVFVEALLLSTIGVAITAGIVGVAAAFLFGKSLTYGLLVGAIISSTDAAAVFSVLRSRSLKLRQNMGDLLEMESGINDPTAAILTVTLITLLTSEHASAATLIFEFIREIVVGAAFGWLMARATVFGINRIGLDYEGLYPVISVAVVIFTFGLSGLLGGSGFLAVYIAGLLLGNANFSRRRSMTQFHDGIAWLSQITMFLMLGVLVFPSDLPSVAWRALLIAAVLVFVARPAAVFISLLFSRRSTRYKLVLSWFGLRGAVPIILATFPLVERIPKADLIFNIVFFATLMNVLLQGTTVPWVANKLGMVSDDPVDLRRPDTVWARDGLHEVIVSADAPGAGRRIVELDVPRDVLFVLISREQEHELPHGATVLRPGDRALLLGNVDNVNAVARRLSGKDCVL